MGENMTVHSTHHIQPCGKNLHIFKRGWLDQLEQVSHSGPISFGRGMGSHGANTAARLPLWESFLTVLGVGEWSVLRERNCHEQSRYSKGACYISDNVMWLCAHEFQFQTILLIYSATSGKSLPSSWGCSFFICTQRMVGLSVLLGSLTLLDFGPITLFESQFSHLWNGIMTSTSQSYCKTAWTYLTSVGYRNAQEMLVTLVDLNWGGCPAHSDFPQGSWLWCPHVFGRIAPPLVGGCRPLIVICKEWAWVPNWIIQSAPRGLFSNCCPFVSVCRTVRAGSLPTARSQTLWRKWSGKVMLTWRGCLSTWFQTSLNPVTSLPWTNGSW